jgi:hypothetical protein
MNFPLYNDKVWTFPLKCQNAAGAVQPGPTTGAWPTAVSDNPASLGASVVYQAPLFNLVLTPKVQASPGISVTVSYVGMASATFTADIVTDPNLISVAIDSADVTSISQSIPSAPGP